jgi:hypothetical protein
MCERHMTDADDSLDAVLCRSAPQGANCPLPEAQADRVRFGTRAPREKRALLGSNDLRRRSSGGPHRTLLLHQARPMPMSPPRAEGLRPHELGTIMPAAPFSLIALEEPVHRARRLERHRSFCRYEWARNSGSASLAISNLRLAQDHGAACFSRSGGPCASAADHGRSLQSAARRSRCSRISTDLHGDDPRDCGARRR